MHHHYNELKIWLLNTAALMFTLTSFQDWLKTGVLLLTIGYTIRKWYIMEKNKNKRDE